MRITTAVTRLLGIDLPILAGGTAQAAMAVSVAGGLGVIEAGHMDADELAAAARQVQAGTARPFAVNIPLDTIGERLGLVLAESTRIVMTSGAGPSRARPAPVWLHAVESLEDALAAAGVDGLVVRICGPGATSLPSGLLRDVARTLPGVPLVATCGADCPDLAEAFALGAGAVWFREPVEGSFADTARRVAVEYEAATGRLSPPAPVAPLRASSRAAREATALRENLLKRKKQARTRLGQP